MEAFFSGLVILFYLLSDFCSEQLFVAACLFPVCYVLLVSILLHFGAQGRIVEAKRRVRKWVRNSVISGSDRALFYERCFRGAPAAAKLAFLAFSEGELGALSFSERIKACVKDRKVLFFGLYFGFSFALSLLVFLSFYFIVPIAEAILRLVIALLFFGINAVVLLFLLYGYEKASDKASTELALLLDGKLLRVKKEREDFALRYKNPPLKTEANKRVFTEEEERAFDLDPSDANAPAPDPAETSFSEAQGMEQLRAMLRDLDAQLQ